MFVSDPIMREIQNLSRLIGIVTLHKDIAYEQIVDENGILSLSNFLRVRLRELTAQGRINDAENYLFEVLATHVTEEKIAVALEFYIRTWHPHRRPAPNSRLLPRRDPRGIDSALKAVTRGRVKG